MTRAEILKYDLSNMFDLIVEFTGQIARAWQKTHKVSLPQLDCSIDKIAFAIPKSWQIFNAT